MQITLRQNARRNKWHIMHPMAVCEHAAFLGLWGKSLQVHFDTDDPDDFEAFSTPFYYIDQTDVCQLCKRDLIRRLKPEGPWPKDLEEKSHFTKES